MLFSFPMLMTMEMWSVGVSIEPLRLMLPEARLGPSHSHGLGDSAFLMAVGALFLCSSLASTEEMMLIAHKMSVWQIATLMTFSMVMTLVFDHVALEEGRGDAKGGSSG